MWWEAWTEKEWGGDTLGEPPADVGADLAMLFLLGGGIICACVAKCWFDPSWRPARAAAAT